MSEIPQPNPRIAAVLSFIFSGLGQIYNGQILKGLLIIAISASGLLAIIIGAILIGYWILFKISDKLTLIAGSLLFLIGLLIVMIIGVYSIFDAYKFTKRPS